MEVNELHHNVLWIVFVGLVLGVGLIVLGGLQNEARWVKQAVNSEVVCNFGVPCTMANVPVNDRFAFTVYNTTNDASHIVPSTAYQLDYGTGVLNLTNSAYNMSRAFNFTYYYYATSAASTGVGGVVTSLATVPSTWLPLIITVMSLAIILTLVIRSFYGQVR